MRKVKTKTVPLKAMDFIQDAYDIKNYILYKCLFIVTINYSFHKHSTITIHLKFLRIVDYLCHSMLRCCIQSEYFLI